MAWRTQSEIYTGIHTNLTILDEPAANIDVVGFRQMEKALKDWCGKNKTCIFISHDIDSLAARGLRGSGLSTGT